MIRLLKGIVEWSDNTHILVDVNGVGYHVYATHDVLANINNIGDAIKVFTHTHVREDLLELYGFATLEELKLFEQLISVSGVGPKTAIGIFTIGSREKIVQAILTNDPDFFTSVPRLGKKNAQKIIIELKNKVGTLENIGSVTSTDSSTNEVMNALKSFGFSPREITDTLQTIDTEGKSVSEKIRLALKQLGK